MKRAGIALCVVIALVGAMGSPASAGERRRTRTLHYQGWDELNLFVGATDFGGSEGPAVFATPWWARSARVLVRDDSEAQIAYKVRFNRPKGANSDDPRGCGGRPWTMALPSGTKRLIVQTEAPFGCVMPALPTTGVITVTFSSRRIR